MTNINISGKKIAMVVAFRDFRDAEYFIPADILTSCGAKIINVSTKKGVAIGVDGGEVNVQLTPKDFNIKDFDALIFIGGSGMAKNLGNQDFQSMARQALEAGKILGAICIAPVLLAKAGLLSGKKATVWSGPMDKSPIKILRECGALYQEKDVVVESGLITANGPDAAKLFAEALLGELDKNL